MELEEKQTDRDEKMHNGEESGVSSDYNLAAVSNTETIKTRPLTI